MATEENSRARERLFKNAGSLTLKEFQVFCLSHTSEGEARALGALTLITEYVEAVEEGTVQYHAAIESLH